MGGSFGYRNDTTPPRFEHLDGGRVVWRSDAPPALLLPESSWLNWSGNITCPDFIKGNGIYYGWNGQIGGLAVYQGVSWSVFRPGTWGPDEPSPRNIPRVTIGTVPSGCNYIDVVANLARVQPLYAVLYTPLKQYQKYGEDIYLDGGCAELEGSHCWRRIFKVVLAPVDNGDGTRNVYLETYQSVKSSSSFLNYIGGSMKTDPQSYDGSATSAWNDKWTHDGDPSGWLSFPIASSGNDIHSMRGGSGQPSTADPSDWTTTWTTTLSVRPGYAHT